MNLIIHIPLKVNRTDDLYFRPCHNVHYIQIDLLHAGISSNVLKILTRFTQTCKIFAKLKRVYRKLELSYKEKINESLKAINILTHETRGKRSIYSAIRHVFNIADYDKQIRLQQTKI